MPLSPNRAPDIADVRRHLEGIVENALKDRFHLELQGDSLLFLQLPRTVAAFAVSEGELSTSFNRAYSAFKKYTTDNRRDWDGLDLVFVFCVHGSNQDLEQFISATETDVYFCRKFVIRLGDDLDMALARLPFLPLTAISRISMRPPSAQTLLQLCGMPAILASRLVVQRERSPEGIIDDCIRNLFGPPPELRVPSQLPSTSQETNAVPVSLKEITIENFRAYRKPQTFRLGSEVTLLYGPNGFGKTSFFDAVDFVLTGGIGRLSTSTDAAFVKAARHLDAGAGEGYVSALVATQSGEEKLVRGVSSRKHPKLDDQTTDRKSVLTRFTGGSLASSDRIENFINLFRATHLFSQEQQELMKGFSTSSDLPAFIVSRMLAFEDYSNAVKKAGEVCSILEGRINGTDERRNELLAQISNDRNEIERLARVANSDQSSDTLTGEITQLRSKVIDSGISVPSDAEPSSVTASTLRGWRAALEAAQGVSQNRSANLVVLASDLGRLAQLRAESSAVSVQVEQIGLALDAAVQKVSELETEAARLEVHFNQVVARRAEAEKQFASMQWVRTNRPFFNRLLLSRDKITAELQTSQLAVAQNREAEGNAAALKGEGDARLSECSNKATALRQMLDDVKTLANSLDPGIADIARRDGFASRATTLRTDLESLKANAPSLTDLVATLAEQEKSLADIIADEEATRSELTNLLSQLQAHVTSGHCLACGDDHGSKEELLARMQRIAADSVSAGRARAELSQIQTKRKQAEESSRENQRKQRAIEEELQQVAAEQERINQGLEALVQFATRLRFSTTQPSTAFKEDVAARQTELVRDLEGAEYFVRQAKEGISAGEESLRNAKSSLQSSLNDVSQKRIALAEIERELETLRGDARQILVPIDTSDEELEGLAAEATENLDNRRHEASQGEEQRARKHSELSSARQEVTGLRSQIASSRLQSVTVQRTITQIEARFSESNVPLHVEEHALRQQISQEATKEAHLGDLVVAASNLELALDASITAAALTQLQQNLRNKEAAVALEAQDKANCGPWLKLFEAASKILGAEQNNAVGNFTRAYGPRTSIIQSRLRSVYGFDDVEMQTQDSSIKVRVRRQGSELRPIDYFSQSQVQTLLLGLFLAACTSQTWSGFCPILLDDPVTHFDDLNVYSFLDLIAGLLETERGRRQFIISTCDQKLMKLARQKFRNSAGAVVFYKFNDIGANGPAVEEISFA